MKQSVPSLHKVATDQRKIRAYEMNAVLAIVAAFTVNGISIIVSKYLIDSVLLTGFFTLLSLFFVIMSVLSFSISFKVIFS